MTNPEQIRKQLESNIAYVRARIHTIENDFARRLLVQYQRAYEDMQNQLEAIFFQRPTWSIDDPDAFRRTQSLVNQIAARMEQLNHQVHDALIDEQIRAYRASYYGNGWILDLITPTNKAVNLPLLPDEAVRAILMYPFEDNTQFFRLENNRLDFIKKMRDAITQSQIRGETVYQAQKRLADLLGIDIGRRKASDRLANEGNFYRTEMIARTELLRSSNLGAMAVYDKNKDVVREYEFIATLDYRTCPFICGPLDGRHFPLSDVMHVPPLHVNCRCTTAPVTDLSDQFAVGARASQFGAVSSNLTYSEWAQQQHVDHRDDGGLRDLPPGKPPKSPGAEPARARPLKGRGLAVK